jgi:hypothetical protein
MRAAVRLGHHGDDGDARGRADGLGAEAGEQGSAGLFGDTGDDVDELWSLGEGVAGRGLRDLIFFLGWVEVLRLRFSPRLLAVDVLIGKEKKRLSITSCFSAFRFTSFPASSSAVSSCTISAIAACLACLFVCLR